MLDFLNANESDEKEKKAGGCESTSCWPLNSRKSLKRASGFEKNFHWYRTGLAAEFCKKVGNSAFCGCGEKFCWLVRKCLWENSELGNDQWEGMTKLRRELQG